MGRRGSLLNLFYVNRRRACSVATSFISCSSSSTSFVNTSSRKISPKDDKRSKMFNQAALWHAIVVIFLEYFAWGLLTVPVINVLSETFPSNKFLMNGLTLGLKGLLSFLGAPLIGACSDVFGRKKFLLLTVFFTCMPIPCLRISPWWYFTFFTLSGILSVTFSVTLAYVADITEKQDRNFAYGLVSATFAGSLITSPAIGAYIGRRYSDDVVVLAATVISILDLIFIALYVPESLLAKDDPDDFVNGSFTRALGNFDPFLVTKMLRAEDSGIFRRLSAILFLSYLSESGQFSCFFVYLRLAIGFTPEAVALFIAFVGLLSVFSQTFVLELISRRTGPKRAITFGLVFQFIQLVCYGLSSSWLLLWGAGFLAALSQITYPALSAFVSLHTEKELQGTVQGVLSGVRGLCQGIGPAIFGLILYWFDVDLSADAEDAGHIGVGPQFPFPHISTHLEHLKRILTPAKAHVDLQSAQPTTLAQSIIPGPPFIFGALLVFIAILLNTSLPETGAGKKIFRRTLLGGGLPPLIDNTVGMVSGRQQKRHHSLSSQAQQHPSDTDSQKLDQTGQSHHHPLLLDDNCSDEEDILGTVKSSVGPPADCTAASASPSYIFNEA